MITFNLNGDECCKYKLDPKCKAASLSSIGSNIIDSFEVLLSWIALHSIQLSPEEEVNSVGWIYRDAKRRGIYLALFTVTTWCYGARIYAN